MPSPRRSPSPRLALASLLAIAFALVLGVPGAEADGKKRVAKKSRDGRAAFQVATVPAKLGPGQKGTLVIRADLLDLHVYGPDDPDEQDLAWKPLEAPGVRYDVDKAQLPATHPYKGKFDDYERPVWERAFTFKVPVELSEDVKAGTKVGIAFTYNACNNDGICFPQVKDHEAFFVVKGGAFFNVKPVVSPPVTEEEGGAELTVEEGKDGKGTLVVTFSPMFGWHFYGPADTGGSIQVEVKPKESEGVTFGEPEYQDPTAVKISGPYWIKVPYTRAKEARKVEVTVIWAGCESSPNGRCLTPREELMGCVWPSGDAEPVAPPVTAPKEPVAKGEILFEVVEDDDLGQGESESSTLKRLYGDSPVLFFGLLFVIGLGLAFTPCVLPIIPITVSVISGGNADIPRQRLSMLLGVYVLGLCMTFATMGVVAAQTGGAMSALFAMPGVQWGLVALFIVLGFGMYGVYELQPPSWLMNLQGGARKRQGSVLGAFLFGCLGAIIASPCTGPAIAVLLILAANEGSAVLGFSMFFVLGLGMGAVLFAAGALNFLMRPGPWMTWVRYVFGVLIVGVAFYYLSQYKLVDPAVMWILAGVVCALAAVGIAWHLHHKEGEEKGPARVRGIKVGVLTLAAIGLVAWYTRVPDNLLPWTYAQSPEHLQTLVAESKAKGKPVVVDFWGDWCTNCKVYDKRIATEPELRRRFEQLTRIKVDLSEDLERWPMRHALGLEEPGAPIMVFFDRKGRIRRAADLVGLQDTEVVVKHIDLVLRKKDAVKTSAR